jgi:serine/threonine protein kinase
MMQSGRGERVLNTLVDQHWGSYRLVRLLGRGSFAEIYLGEHVDRGTQVAVKILHTSLSGEAARAFQREAQIIAGLTHPHIIRILDFAIQDDRPFLVLEYAPNGSLRQRHPRDTQVPLPVVVEYVSQIASALQYAHERKLIHRDVKPGNMLVGQNGNILLSDFGIATVAHSTASMNTQEAQGTLAYMAPEQIEGHPRPASDQYALGIVAYQWLTGRTPFRGTSSEIIAQHLGVSPRSLREHAPQMSEDIERIIQRAMAKEPRARFSSVRAFANALQQAAEAMQSAIPAKPAHSPQANPDTLPAPADDQNIPLAPQPEATSRADIPAIPSAKADDTSATLGKRQRTVTMPTTPLLPLPVDASQDEPTATTGRSATAYRFHVGRAILLIAALCILLVGSIVFWYTLPFLHSAQAGPKLSAPNTSTNTNATPGGSGSGSVGHTGIERSTPPGTDPRASATQPVVPSASPSASTPASQPTPAPDCLSGSTHSLTMRQILGKSASSAVTLTNCSAVAGNWTATVQTSGGSGWTSCNPTGGTIPAGETQTVQITAGSSNMLVGTYTARWTFTMGSASWTVDVTLTIIG